MLDFQLLQICIIFRIFQDNEGNFTLPEDIKIEELEQEDPENLELKEFELETVLEEQPIKNNVKSEDVTLIEKSSAQHAEVI